MVKSEARDELLALQEEEDQLPDWARGELSLRDKIAVEDWDRNEDRGYIRSRYQSTNDHLRRNKVVIQSDQVENADTSELPF